MSKRLPQRAPRVHALQPLPPPNDARHLLRMVPAASPAQGKGELWAALHLPGLDSAAALHSLGVRALRFTSRVSLEPPDGLLLEVRGSLQLFAGVRALSAALSEEYRGLQAAVSFAPTALAALLLARSAKPRTVLERAQLTGQLAPLPLSVLRWPAEVIERLKRIGVRTLGALLRLPRAGFAQRFGVTQLNFIDRLTGRTAEVRLPLQARERFRRRRELPCELENHAGLLAALTPQVEELALFLRARQRGITELECRFLHRQLPATRCVLKLAAPAAQAQHLLALLQERLSRLRLPAPVRSLELRADTLIERAGANGALWQPGEHGGEVSGEGCELIERLRVRLGEEAIHGLTLRDDHRPERAWTPCAPPAPGVQRAAPGPAGSPCRAARPLWLLPTPRPLQVQDGRPCCHGALQLLGEAERIESGWWDGQDVARDYYTAIDRHGVRLWVFRERAAPHQWFLQGVFG